MGWSRDVPAGETASYRVPSSPAEIANTVFHTIYLGTVNSSNATKQRAATLASEIGCYHLDASIDGVVEAFIQVFTTATGHSPKFEAHGGSHEDDLALQNVQAR